MSWPAILPEPSPAADEPVGVDETPAPAVDAAGDDRESEATDAESDEDQSASAAAAPTSAPEPTDLPKPTAISSPIPTLASTAIPTPLPTAILPPEGLKGSQDLLDLFASAGAAPFWDEREFKPAGDAWRLGVSGETEGDTIFLAPPADLLDRSYGNDASQRISRERRDRQEGFAEGVIPVATARHQVEGI